MSAVFPGGIVEFTPKQGGVDKIYASNHNSIQEEIMAIETFLINKEAIQTVFKMIYPVGHIYISTSSTNPGTLFGGTWEAFGAGRTLISVDGSDADFNTSKKTGGAKTHNHPLSDLGISKVAISTAGNISTSHTPNMPSWTAARKITGTYGADTGTYTSGAGLAGTTDNGSALPPYITVYMWERTA